MTQPRDDDSATRKDRAESQPSEHEETGPFTDGAGA